MGSPRSGGSDGFRGHAARVAATVGVRRIELDVKTKLLAFNLCLMTAAPLDERRDSLRARSQGIMAGH